MGCGLSATSSFNPCLPGQGPPPWGPVEVTVLEHPKGCVAVTHEEPLACLKVRLGSQRPSPALTARASLCPGQEQQLDFQPSEGQVPGLRVSESWPCGVG